MVNKNTYTFNFIVENNSGLSTDGNTYSYTRKVSEEDYNNLDEWLKAKQEKYNQVFDLLKSYHATYTVTRNNELGVDITINVTDTPLNLEMIVQLEHLFTQTHFNKFIEVKYFVSEFDAKDYIRSVWMKQPSYCYINMFEICSDYVDENDISRPYLIVYSEENFMLLKSSYDNGSSLEIKTDLIDGDLYKETFETENGVNTLAAISVNAVLEVYGNTEEAIIHMINQIKNEYDEYNQIKNLGKKMPTQGLDEHDNPDLINDVLTKPDIIYTFRRNNEHDTRVINHSIIHYRDDKEYMSCLFTNGDNAYFLTSKTVRRYINENNDKLVALNIVPTVIEAIDAEGNIVNCIGLYVKDDKVLSENEVTNILYLINYGVEYKK